MVKLSQYEIEREANIARNRALLEQLELKQAVTDLGVASTSRAGGSSNSNSARRAAKPVQPSKRPKRERSEVEIAPRRQSARLMKVDLPEDPDESPAKKRRREAEYEERRAKEAEERLEAEEQARLAKRARHQDLDLAALMEDQDADEADLVGLTNELQAVAQNENPRRVGEPDAFVYEGESTNEEREVTDLRERLRDMKVVARAKVTQDRVYSAAYHPEVTKDLVFFGDKHGQLGIWDARAAPKEVADEDGDVTQEQEGGQYHRLQLHWPATSKSSISSVKLDPINSHNLYTSSYDCTIRSLSFTTGVSHEVFAMEDQTLISSIDLAPNGHEMWISDGLGGATHLDMRESRRNKRRYELSDHKIGSISINPTRPHFLVTASNSRAMRIWDTRKLLKLAASAVDDDDDDEAPPTPPPSSPGQTSTPSPVINFDSDAVTEFLGTKNGKSCLRGEWRHDKSVSSAFWDPRGRSIVSTSYDDTIRLWDVDSDKFESNAPFPSSRPFSRINHNCQTGKWLTILRAQWTPNPDVYPHFTIGNMKRSLDIFSCKGDLIARLRNDDLISAVQAVTCSHPNVVERAVSGNASGRCVLWAPEDVGFS